MNSLHSLSALVTEGGPVGVESNVGETATFWVCATLAVLGALGTVLARKAVHSALAIAVTMINLAVLYVAQDAPFLGMVQIIVYTEGGNVEGIGVTIFTRFLLAFEVTAALLITAAVGAMVLTHRERLTPRKSQAQLSTERFAPDRHPGNKPSPGVYARNNAVDMPALLPDGSTSPDSVPGPLRVQGETRPADRLALDEAELLSAHEPVVVEAAEAPDPDRAEHDEGGPA